MIPQEKTYPVFEANQVLSKRHLNELFKYLDEQNRLTRTNLIGVGIVCGLEISPSIDGKTIQLSKGCGITSKGLVAVIPDDNTNKSVKDSIILSRYIDYKVPKGLDYPAFYQKDDITKQYGLWELLSENDPGSQELSNLDLSDKVLLLFVECLEDSLKNCSPNSCDDKGIEVKITIRKLLITKIDLAKIISNSEDLKSALDTDGMVKYLTSRLNLPDLKLRRFNLPNSNVDSAEKIFAAYKEILGTVEESNSSIILEVQNALSKAYLAFYPIIKSIDGMDTDPFLKGQLLNISKHFLQNKSDKNIIYVQYLYDFISDLIQAYDEFRWKGIELLALCCPSEELFPFHLMIGEIYGNDIAGKKVFRHYFRSSAILANQRNLYEEVLSLFQRLVKMVNNFTNPAFLSNNKTIRITPSTLGAFPLSQKAIPFYFDVMKLYEQWSFEKTSVGRANQNHSYFASDQTTYANQDFIKKPLEYDLETFNFFRVEGLIGMDWRDALKDILDKIFRYRLPFDVVALNADNMTVNSDPQPPRCINNDLDIIYKLWQKELACMLATKMSYWTGLNYKTLKYNPVALSATKIELVEETPIKAKILVRPETLKVENKLSETVKPYYNVGTPSSISNVVLNSTLFHEDTLGKAFLDTLKSGKTSDVNGLKIGIIDKVKQDPTIANLKMDDYQILVDFPINMVASMYDYTEAIPDGINEIDYNLVDERFKIVTQNASAYLDALHKLPDNYANIAPDDKKKLVDELENLLKNCLQNRLAQLSDEILKRKKSVESLLYFSEYVKKHPDFQHKAGVPVGGTFIIVYKENNDSLPSKSSIPEQVVIADFYLPYRCCSDCPPVQFVLPPPRPAFTPEVGCTNENGEAIVSINILHGDAPYQIKVDDKDYIPLDKTSIKLTTGIHTLTLLDSAGGESVPVPIEVKKQMQLDPGAKICDPGGETFTLSIYIIGGSAPFKVNGQTPLESVLTTEKNYRIVAGPFTSGKETEVIVTDSLGCSAKPFKLNFSCIKTQDDNVSTPFRTPITIEVLKNDIGNQLSITKASLQSPADGILTVNGGQTITFTPASGVSSKSVIFSYEVKDLDNKIATANVTVNVGENPCKLPCDGLAIRCNYRFWLPVPLDERIYETYDKGKLSFIFDGPNGSIDISKEVNNILVSTTKELNKNFDNVVLKWFDDINTIIEKKTDSKDWLRIDYMKVPNGTGTILVERFKCLSFSFNLGLEYQKSKTKHIENYSYTEKGVEIKYFNTEGKLLSTINIPPGNCLQLNKCEKLFNNLLDWLPIFKTLDFKPDIKKTMQETIVSFEVVDLELVEQSLIIWELEDAYPSIQKGSNVSYSLKGVPGKIKNIWLTFYFKSGYAVTFPDTISING